MPLRPPWPSPCWSCSPPNPLPYSPGSNTPASHCCLDTPSPFCLRACSLAIPLPRHSQARSLLSFSLSSDVSFPKGVTSPDHLLPSHSIPTLPTPYHVNCTCLFSSSISCLFSVSPAQLSPPRKLVLICQPVPNSQNKSGIKMCGMILRSDGPG